MRELQKKTLNLLSAPIVTICDTKRNPHAPPPRGTSVLPALLSPRPADGTCPIPGVTAGDCAAGSLRGLVPGIGEGSSNTPVRACALLCGAPAVFLSAVLQ